MATLVAFHAHPDDEAVLTGGTLAGAVEAGHRVILVTATDGRVGDEDDDIRMDELLSSASVLGVHRVECLGYADSGDGPVFYPDPPGRVRFARAEVEAAAQRLAAILRDENAQLLLSYQPNGGYGHRDHVQVHHVGKRAAELAATPRVLEATMPRELLRRLCGLCRLLRLPAPYDADTARTAYAPQATITHRSTSGRSPGKSAMPSPRIVRRSAAGSAHGCSGWSCCCRRNFSGWCSATNGSSIRMRSRALCAAISSTTSNRRASRVRPQQSCPPEWLAW